MTVATAELRRIEEAQQVLRQELLVEEIPAAAESGQDVPTAGDAKDSDSTLDQAHLVQRGEVTHRGHHQHRNASRQHDTDRPLAKHGPRNAQVERHQPGPGAAAEEEQQTEEGNGRSERQRHIDARVRPRPAHSNMVINDSSLSSPARGVQSIVPAAKVEQAQQGQRLLTGSGCSTRQPATRNRRQCFQPMEQRRFRWV